MIYTIFCGKVQIIHRFENNPTNYSGTPHSERPTRLPKVGNDGDLHLAGHGTLWGDIHLAAIEVTDDHIDRALNGAEVFADDLQGILAQFSPMVLIAKQIADGFFQPVFVLDLNRAACGEEVSRNIREILHVRSENHRLAQRAGFDGVLATLGGQTFAYEN